VGALSLDSFQTGIDPLPIHAWSSSANAAIDSPLPVPALSAMTLAISLVVSAAEDAHPCHPVETRPVAADKVWLESRTATPERPFCDALLRSMRL
jgi:hypothetical protein